MMECCFTFHRQNHGQGCLEIQCRPKMEGFCFSNLSRTLHAEDLHYTSRLSDAKVRDACGCAVIFFVPPKNGRNHSQFEVWIFFNKGWEKIPSSFVYIYGMKNYTVFVKKKQSTINSLKRISVGSTPQDATAKWRFRLGFPLPKMFHVILVVTSQLPGWGGNPRKTDLSNSNKTLLTFHGNPDWFMTGSLYWLME